MTRRIHKTLLATAAIAFAGIAAAQGTPPNPNVSNPALGAGQQSQQGTPMGTTGVPAAPAAAPMPNTPPPPAANMSSSDSTMAPPRGMRPARADRN